MRTRYYFLLLGLFTALPIHAQTTVTLTPSKDNTLYESSTGSLSNGAGAHLFTGQIRTGEARRALLAFDLSSIPSGAQIQSATLRMNVSNATAPTTTVSLHRVTADWGEGTSNAAGNEGGGASSSTGDATWIHRFFNTDRWQLPGGDFAGGASASVQIGGTGSYTWQSTAAMVADVQLWLDQPQNNFGWIVIGDESANQTAKRLDSMENGTSGNRPQLQITYSTGVAVEDEIPRALVLGANFPNPFTFATTIPLELDAARHVSLKVYDVLGRTVRTVANGFLQPGLHHLDVSATDLPGGAYAYCYEADGGRECRTLVVAK